MVPDPAGGRGTVSKVERGLPTTEGRSKVRRVKVSVSSLLIISISSVKGKKGKERDKEIEIER